MEKDLTLVMLRRQECLVFRPG